MFFSIMIVAISNIAKSFPTMFVCIRDSKEKKTVIKPKNNTKDIRIFCL